VSHIKNKATKRIKVDLKEMYVLFKNKDHCKQDQGQLGGLFQAIFLLGGPLKNP